MKPRKFSRKSIWAAARLIENKGDPAMVAKELGIDETDAFKTMVEKTHTAKMGSMPARSKLCEWMREEGLVKGSAAKPATKSATKRKNGGAPKAAKRSGRSITRNADSKGDNASLVKQARTILRETPNLKQFCEAAGIPPASAYKWRSGNETLTARSASRIVSAAQSQGNGSERKAPTSGRRDAPRRAVGAARARIVGAAKMTRSAAIDIESDIELISRARGESKQDTMLSIVQNHMREPGVRKSLEVLRRHAAAQEQMEAALAAL